MKSFLFLVVAVLLVATPAIAANDMVNEDWVLAVGEAHMHSFTLPTPAVLQVDMSPVAHADKGVLLRLVPTEDFDSCTGRVQGGQCRARTEFDGLAVRSFSHTATLPAGRWTFFVQNKYNDFFRATVHVHLVLNP